MEYLIVYIYIHMREIFVSSLPIMRERQSAKEERFMTERYRSSLDSRISLAMKE